MENLQVGSREFLQACKEMTIKTYKDKVTPEILDSLLALTPDPDEQNVKNGIPTTDAKVTVTAAFVWGTVKCEISSQKKVFEGTHWGIGLAGFASYGVIYTAYNSWDAFFSNAKAYHCQSFGAAGGIVQVNWFNDSGVPVGQFDGVAGGAGAMEVGGSGSWKNM